VLAAPDTAHKAFVVVGALPAQPFASRTGLGQSGTAAEVRKVQHYFLYTKGVLKNADASINRYGPTADGFLYSLLVRLAL
jgi:hypothetical protein